MTIIEMLERQTADLDDELKASEERKQKLEREIAYLKGYIAGKGNQGIENAALCHPAENAGGAHSNQSNTP